MLMVCVPDRPRYKKKGHSQNSDITCEEGEGGVGAVRRAAPRLVLQYVRPLCLPCGTANLLPFRRLHRCRGGVSRCLLAGDVNLTSCHSGSRRVPCEVWREAGRE